MSGRAAFPAARGNGALARVVVVLVIAGVRGKSRAQWDCGVVELAVACREARAKSIDTCVKRRYQALAKKLSHASSILQF